MHDERRVHNLDNANKTIWGGNMALGMDKLTKIDADYLNYAGVNTFANHVGMVDRGEVIPGTQ